MSLIRTAYRGQATRDRQVNEWGGAKGVDKADHGHWGGGGKGIPA
jgi:hypothetical protein